MKYLTTLITSTVLFTSVLFADSTFIQTGVAPSFLTSTGDSLFGGLPYRAGRGILSGTDLDGDSQQEVWVTSYQNGGQIFCFEETGSDTLAFVWASAEITADGESYPRDVHTGDLDGDGKGEIIFHVGRFLEDDNPDAGLHIYEWDGSTDNGYGTEAAFRVDFLDALNDSLYESRVEGFSVGDIDSDGQEEILLANNGSSNPMDGWGTQDGSTPYSGDRFIIMSVSGDIGGTGATIVEEYSMSPRDVDKDGVRENALGGGSPMDMVICDTDGDGLLEAACFSWNNLNLFFIEATGPDAYTIGDTSYLKLGISDDWTLGASVADMNGDGKDEVYVSGWDDGSLFVITDADGDANSIDQTGSAGDWTTNTEVAIMHEFGQNHGHGVSATAGFGVTMGGRSFWNEEDEYDINFLQLADGGDPMNPNDWTLTTHILNDATTGVISKHNGGLDFDNDGRLEVVLSYQAVNDTTTTGELAPYGNRVFRIAEWGVDSNPPLNLEMIASNQYNIAGGLDYSMAINSDRTLTVWGSYSDQNGNIDNVSNVFSIARGYFHTGVLFTDGTVGYYGDNGEGNPENIPDDLNEVVMLVGGADHFLALKSDGTVVAWGKNDTEQATVPSDLSGTIVGMSAGDNHSTVLFSDGTCRNWGDVSSANDFTDIRPVPEAIASGRGFDIAIKNDSTVVSTDDYWEGINAVPDGLSGVVAVACGNYHSLALKSDGTVVAWGENGYGQTDVPLGLDNVVAIAGGMKGYHSIALKSDGTVVAWGNDDNGQSSGVPDDLDALVYLSPTDVPAIVDIWDIPDDQGKWVYIQFIKSVHDIGDGGPLGLYNIERLDNEEWVSLHSIAAYGAEYYTTEAHTLMDSTGEHDGMTTYRVVAAIGDVGVLISETATGYSVDNIAPGVPQGLMAVLVDEGIHITWEMSADEDFQYYMLEKSSDEAFTEPEVFEMIDIAYLDLDYVLNESNYYRIAAVDHAGNISDYSDVVDFTVLATDVDLIPDVFALHQNYPNPFNPVTTLQYDLPEDALVNITIYDIMSRIVKNLVSSQQNAGYKSIQWNATNHLGQPVSAGLYLYTIEAGKFRQTKKMVLLK